MDFGEYMKLVEEKKITVSNACKELGISRQTWYNKVKSLNSNKEKKKVGRPRKITQECEREKRKPGRPRKNATEPVELPKYDWAAILAEEDKRTREWMTHISDATDEMISILNSKFGRTWLNLRFEHVDAAAYWYTFELVNYRCRQTLSVRHSDVAKRISK